MDISVELVEFDSPCWMRLVARGVLTVSVDSFVWFLKDDVVLSRHKGYIL